MYNTSVNKKYRVCVFAAVVLLISMIMSLPVCAAYPKHENYIGDEAGILAEHTERTLIKNNEILKKDLGVMIAVATVKTTDGVDIAEYTRALYKKWNLGDGILILVAVDDADYYIVQSKNIEKLITNEDLADVRDNFLAEDFDAGNIDRGILKAGSRLYSLLVSELQEAAEAEAKEAETETEKKGTTVGSVIVGLFIFCLCIVLIAVLAFAVLFVAAMFNEECAEFMRTRVFRRGSSRTPSYNYDERLYGNQNRGQRRDPYAQNRQILDQRRSNPNYNPHRTGYGGGLDGYEPYNQYNRQRPAQNQRPAGNQGYQNRPAGALVQGQAYYNADGSMRQSRPQQNAAQRPQNRAPQGYAQNQNRPQARPQAQGYGQNRPQQGYGQNYARQNAPRQQRPYQDAQQYNAPQYNAREDDAGATRAFTIPGRGNQ